MSETIEPNTGTIAGAIPAKDSFAKDVLNSLSAHIAIIDSQGVIVETNQAWKRFSCDLHPDGFCDFIGVNYLSVCEATEGIDRGDAMRVAEGVRSVIRGDVDEFLYDYPCHAPDEKHWYYLRAIRMTGTEQVHVIISHEEITKLKLTEEALRKREQELHEKKQGIEETNIALKVLLKQREDDKKDMEMRVLTNMKDMVMPYVDKLKIAPLRPREKTIIGIVETHINEIISPFLQRVEAANILLTPQEIQVSALVKDGKTSKEIAEILNVSETTVHFHRKNLRTKLGIKNHRTNLRSYLMSLS
ncbi:MAG: helix-turn-helix transcriptional regulator [Desulfobacteraceae bacterium]|nr:helix-turn-helix transcriptional regulator [Desulfobacteraceae bacterium]